MRQSRWQLGYLIPRMMVALVIIDGVLRFFSPTWIAFRAWEVLLRRLPTATGPFYPSLRYQNDAAYGDLASLGNRPDMRQYRKVTVTTDEEGYRRVPNKPQAAPTILVIGDSYSVGAEVSDEDAYSALVASDLGVAVYNGAGSYAMPAATIRSTARRLGMHGGIVLYQFLERYAFDAPPRPVPSGDHFDEVATAVLGEQRWAKLRMPLTIVTKFSTLQATAQRIEKMLEDDWFLPNRFAENIAARKLSDGQEALFLLTDTIQPSSGQNQAASRWVSYWSWLASELRKDNFVLVVLLVPNKYTVYRPLLANRLERSAHEPPLLDHFAKEAQNAGLPALNLTGILRSEVAKSLGAPLGLYWRDDSHWTRRGHEIVARELAQFLISQDFLGRSAGFSDGSSAVPRPDTISDTAASGRVRGKFIPSTRPPGVF